MYATVASALFLIEVMASSVVARDEICRSREAYHACPPSPSTWYETGVAQEGNVCVTPAQVTNKVPLQVPPPGTGVVAKLFINSDGELVDARFVVSSEGVSEKALRSTLHQWKLEPGRLCGYAVPVVQKVVVPTIVNESPN